MATIFKLDATEFNQTIDKYLELSRRERVNELNRRAANICARAANLTPRASPDQIVRDMKAIETVMASYVKVTKRKGESVALGKGGRTTQGKSTVGYMGKTEAFAIANFRLQRGKRMGFYSKFPKNFAGPGRGNSGGTASAFYQRFVKRARSSSGYIAAGWLPAFRHFSQLAKGQTIKIAGGLDKFFKTLKGSAGQGFGIEAIQAGDKVKAIFVNAAKGAGKIGQRALQDALKQEQLDMIPYIERKEQEALNKANR
jgi:hypothetical protein